MWCLFGVMMLLCLCVLCVGGVCARYDVVVAFVVWVCVFLVFVLFVRVLF